jgi:hypothetical protein
MGEPAWQREVSVQPSQDYNHASQLSTIERRNASPTHRLRASNAEIGMHENIIKRLAGAFRFQCAVL